MRNSLKRTCVYYLYCRERRADSVACEVDLKLHSPTGANTLISSQAKPSATHSSETNRMTIKRHPPQEQAYWPSSMILLRNKQSDSRAPSSTETIAFWQPRVILTEQTKMSNKRNPSGWKKHHGYGATNHQAQMDLGARGSFLGFRWQNQDHLIVLPSSKMWHLPRDRVCYRDCDLSPLHPLNVFWRKTLEISVGLLLRYVRSIRVLFNIPPWRWEGKTRVSRAYAFLLERTNIPLTKIQSIPSRGCKKVGGLR